MKMGKSLSSYSLARKIGNYISNYLKLQEVLQSGTQIQSGGQVEVTLNLVLISKKCSISDHLGDKRK